MKKLYRLLKSSEFKSVLDKRHCILKDSSFSIYYAGNDLTHVRIGISVSNKIGDAVTRVRIRRQIRAMIADINKEYNCYSFNEDVVIIVRSGFTSKTYQENKLVLSNVFASLLNMRNEK